MKVDNLRQLQLLMGDQAFITFLVRTYTRDELRTFARQHNIERGQNAIDTARNISGVKGHAALTAISFRVNLLNRYKVGCWLDHEQFEQEIPANYIKEFYGVSSSAVEEEMMMWCKREGIDYSVIQAYAT